VYRKFLLTLVVCLGFGGLKAQTILGSQIDYLRIDSFQYEIRYQIFTDCRDSAFQLDSDSYCTIWSANAGETALSPSLVAVRDISNYHDTITHCGTSDTVIGILQYTYLDTVNFNITYSSYKSDTLVRFTFHTDKMWIGTNIMCGTTAKYRTSYNYAEINPTLDGVGTHFRNDPQFFTPNNNGIHSSFNAAINNGFDSVSYSLGISYNDSTSVQQNCSLPCNFPIRFYYPGSNPCYMHPNANPPIGGYFNSITSELIYTPVVPNEDAVFVVEAYNWSKNNAGAYKKVGTIRLEQIRFNKNLPYYYDNNLPTIDGPHTYSVCANNQICFNITTDDISFYPPPPASTPPADTVTLKWDSAIAHLGATFTIVNSSALHQTGRFCWTPADSSVSSLPYHFTVIANDNRGYFGGLTSRIIRVTVKKIAEFETSYAPFSCGTLNGLKNEINIDSSSGTSFACTRRILDSTGKSITTNALWFSSSKSVLSTRTRDTLLGDTAGRFIIETTLNNPPNNCPVTLRDTVSMALFTYKYGNVQDTVLICDKSSDSISVGDSWQSIQWSTGDSTSAILIDSAKQYFVRVTDSCGNQLTKYFTVLMENSPHRFVQDTLLCPRSPITFVYADSQAHKATWNALTLNDTFKLSSVGKYFVSIDKRCGSYTDSFEVGSNAVSFSIKKDETRCDSSLFTIVPSTGVNVNYTWYLNYGASKDTFYADSVLVNTPASIKVKGINACDSKEILSTAKPITAPVINIPDPKRHNCSPTAITFAAGGLSTDSFLWSTGYAGQNLTVSSFGTYILTTLNKCAVDRDTVIYVQNVRPEVGFHIDSSTCGKLIIDPIVLKGFGPFNYYWIQDGVYKASTGIISSKLEYNTLYASNSCGSVSRNVHLQPPLAPTISIAQDSILECSKIQVIIAPTGNFLNNWQWNTGDLGVSIVVHHSGSYKVTNSRFCGTAQDSVYVLIDSLPSASLRADTSICQGDSTVLLVQNKQVGVSVLWQDGSRKDSLVAKQAGIYRLDLSNACGSSSDSFELVVQQVPTVNLGTDLTLARPISHTLNAGVADSYLWSTGDTGQTIQVSDTGTYWVVATNICGSSSDTIRVFTTASIYNMKAAGIQLYPNPANQFIVLESHTIKPYRLEILDIAGRVVFTEAMLGTQTKFNVGHLNAGSYTVRVFVGNDVFWDKLILK
jgi:hypothetical protein